jgi:ABC-type branched-subunit amino acid transport system substrate-binding protein
MLGTGAGKRLLLGLWVVVLAMAACGGDNAATTTTAGGQTASSSPPTGKPLTFGVMSQDTGTAITSNIADGVEAWADYINKKGGLDGRPVRLSRCDDAANTEKNQQCAKGFVDNPDIVAVLGGQARFSGTVAVPLYQAANLLYVCPAPLTNGEFQGTTSFCSNGGTIGQMLGTIKYMVDQGKKKMALIRIDAISGQGVSDFFKANLLKAGGELVKDVPVPPGSADVFPAVTAALQSNPDFIFNGAGPNDQVAVLKALQSLGATQPVVMFGIGVNQALVQAAGAAFNNVYVINTYPPVDTGTDPELKVYTDAVKAFGKGVPGEDSLGGWVAGRTVETGIRKLGADKVTRQALLDYLKNSDLSGIPLMPATVSAKKVPTSLGFPVPGLINTTSIMTQYSGGKFVAKSERIVPAIT